MRVGGHLCFLFKHSRASHPVVCVCVFLILPVPCLRLLFLRCAMLVIDEGFVVTFVEDRKSRARREAVLNERRLQTLLVREN